ncbi:hypothetical protein Fmac_019188 [Flemingia macrophylla]|uniref:Uncharacterized protein n=1 Tax=Flemingia macrophylla TaxID=520843 RepID=A0ABD1M7J0_9FABA
MTQLSAVEAFYRVTILGNMPIPPTVIAFNIVCVCPTNPSLTSATPVLLADLLISSSSSSSTTLASASSLASGTLSIKHIFLFYCRLRLESLFKGLPPLVFPSLLMRFQGPSKLFKGKR